MKKILGLDLGTNSIGWALVNEANNENQESEIVKLGVRVNPLTVDEKTNFEKGQPLSTNADRTAKRGARRNLQRYKLRRKNLIEILIKNNFITEETPLTEIGKNTTYQTLQLRAKAAKEKIQLNEFARVLLAINKKRGYKSNRKAKGEDEGQAIDGMAVAKELYDNNLTPGQYCLKKLEEGKKYIPDFYRSDLQKEFDKIWNYQKQFYPTILVDELYQELKGKNKKQTWAICKKPFNIEGIKLNEKGDELKKINYRLRSNGLTEKLDMEYLAIALQEINNDLNKSNDYLGKISDRSKELFFNKETVGENLWKQIQKNRHISLKNKVFYRQDYLDEFEQIWKTQSKFYPQLDEKLKEEIRDVIIFYQRKLKSQKGLLSYCQFEHWEEEYIDEVTGKKRKRIVGHKVISKSSPLFQEFKIWQNLNSLKFTNSDTNEYIEIRSVEENIRKILFEELNIRGDLKPNDVIKLIAKFFKIEKISEWKCNYGKIEGNLTNKALYNIYQKIAENEGYGFDWSKKKASEIKEELQSIFPELGIDASILDFDADKDFDKQSSYQLWHLLYSAESDFKITEEDKIIYGNSDINLKKKLHKKYGFEPRYAKMLANISLQQDYGNLSSKAIKKILPYLKDGSIYSEACALADINHSHSETKEELENRDYADKLEPLKKNSLRNPVVEKIINQMVNLVNQIIDNYGKPEEIRIELARKLKKSAQERSKMIKSISEATQRNEDIKKKITRDFRIPNPTKNDVIRYRLWEELESNGYKSVFSDEYIPYEKLFSKDIDIEHIIPKAVLFDDSFSNKTLAYKKINLQKGERTALDFMEQDFYDKLDDYRARVERLYKNAKISGPKRNKLLMSQKDLPEDFIERDLRNSQYIAKEASKLLHTVFKTVVSTSGSITDKLREDWGLINVMKELNLPKYKALGLTEIEKRLDNGNEELKEVEVIKDWSKRNDHRHHAMDALTVAFTTHNHIQYINNLNARKDRNHKKHNNIIAIEKVVTELYEHNNGRKKRKFKPPMQNLRSEAKEHIESILISFKNKNKVVTQNKNIIKLGNDKKTKVQLTPRGQLHKETIYGKSKRILDKPKKLNKNFSFDNAILIANPIQKELVIKHLSKFNNDAKIAFDSKTLKNNPLIYKGEKLKEVKCFEEIYTIRKDITPELKIDKVVDNEIRKILEERLDKYSNNAKESFSNLDENPIWFNEEKGIAIKRVTITGVSNAEPLHYKKDHLGKEILDENNRKQPVDFISTGNNHHVAIYQDADGNLQEKVVSFYEAVIRANEQLPIVDKRFNEDIGWKFLFTMKQNEMFIFPSEDFNPNEIDLIDEKNCKIISKHLFRVQKIATKDYVFRHHLETTVENNNKLKDICWKREGLSGINNIRKVRINHLGQIVQVGEY